jgi:hypothetical protein
MQAPTPEAYPHKAARLPDTPGHPPCPTSPCAIRSRRSSAAMAVVRGESTAAFGILQRSAPSAICMVAWYAEGSHRAGRRGARIIGCGACEGWAGAAARWGPPQAGTGAASNAATGLLGSPLQPRRRTRTGTAVKEKRPTRRRRWVVPYRAPGQRQPTSGGGGGGGHAPLPSPGRRARRHCSRRSRLAQC